MSFTASASSRRLRSRRQIDFAKNASVNVGSCLMAMSYDASASSRRLKWCKQTPLQLNAAEYVGVCLMAETREIARN